MAKFYAYLKNNTQDKILGSFDTENAAIQCCVDKVRDMYSSESEQARKALEQRGYYCMQWSQNEVYIEER